MKKAVEIKGVDHSKLRCFSITVKIFVLPNNGEVSAAELVRGLLWGFYVNDLQAKAMPADRSLSTLFSHPRECGPFRIGVHTLIRQIGQRVLVY